MKPNRLFALALPLVLAAACGGSDSGADPNATMVPVGNAGGTIAATKEGVRDWLATNEYKTWSKEAAPHDSSGPHGTVQSYFNEKYRMARMSETYPMPVGATSVKEILDGSTLDGWAVGIKTKAGDGADTWTWYETFTGDLPEVKYFGVANPTCEGCHQGAANKDRSLTPTVP